MSTLLLQFKAPMQSWGICAKFDNRSTEYVPSKSAVIGMIAGALGRKRNESVDDLNNLRFGVRVDKEGKVMHDFQTAKNPNKKTSVYGKPGIYRDYLEDAAFLVGVEGTDAFLQTIEYALKHPVFPIFLGRRSCPPAGQVVLGIKDAALLDALKAEPWIAKDKDRGDRVRFVLDAADDEEESYSLRDKAVSFDQRNRRFAFRRIRDFLAKPDNSPVNVTDREPDTDHNAMSELF